MIAMKRLLSVQNSLIAAICLILALYALSQALQLFAIFSLSLAIAFLYKDRVLDILHDLTDTTKGVKQAGLSPLKLSARDKLIDVEALFPDTPQWAKAILTGMTSANIAMLLNVSNSKRFKFSQSQVGNLGALRHLGLLEHDATSLATSQFAWISKLGSDLVLELKKHTL